MKNISNIITFTSDYNLNRGSNGEGIILPSLSVSNLKCFNIYLTDNDNEKANNYSISLPSGGKYFYSITRIDYQSTKSYNSVASGGTLAYSSSSRFHNFDISGFYIRIS